MHLLDVHEEHPLRAPGRRRQERFARSDGACVEHLEVTAAAAEEAGGAPAAHCLALGDSAGAVRCLLLRPPAAAAGPAAAELAALRALA